MVIFRMSPFPAGAAIAAVETLNISAVTAPARTVQPPWFDRVMVFIVFSCERLVAVLCDGAQGKDLHLPRNRVRSLTCIWSIPKLHLPVPKRIGLVDTAHPHGTPRTPKPAR